jgi:cytochrome c biogenesis protein CcdA
MKVYRKSLFIQFLLFIVFFLMGGNVIITHYFRESMPWLAYVLLGILILFGIVGFILYKKEDPRISIITEQEVKTIRYLLYGYFFIYILQMVLSNVATIDKELLNIATGVILMGIALYGAWIQYKVLRVK